MAPVVIHLNSAHDVRDVVHRAVQALAEGKLVVFPTETVYGLAVSALNAEAVERLVRVKDRKEGHAITLAVKSAEEAIDYVPKCDSLGRRMARRCWPGPVTLVLPDNEPDSLIRRLPEIVQSRVTSNGRIGLRVPAHQLVLDVLRLIPGPLALSSANRMGEPDSITADEACLALKDDVDLVLDDGRSQFGQPSSVVQVEDGKLTVLREGVVSSATLQRLASYMVLLVCTGNTCRSPMAELLSRKRIAERIGCKIADLEDRGVIVMSSGLAAEPGGRPTPEAVQAMAERGLDLSGHVTQPISDRLVRHADVILTMTKGHRQAIVDCWPEAAERTFTLAKDQTDIADPIGAPREHYRRCADQIDSALRQRIDELDL